MAEESTSECDEIQTPKMFDGLTAWFSGSVAQKRIDLWVENDGQLETLDNALYVFSENAKSEDTIRVFESNSYLQENLAVFHPTFIEECLRQGDMRVVTLGNYSLVPAEISDAIDVPLPWQVFVQKEQEQQSKTSQKSQPKTPTKPAKYDEPAKESTAHQQNAKARSPQLSSLECHDGAKSKTPLRPPNSSPTPQLNSTKSPTKRKLQLQNSPLRKVLPRKFHKTSSEATSPVPTDATSKRQKMDLDVGNHESGEEPYEDYAWVDTLPRVTETIEDFIVGEAGCSVYRKTSENG